MKGTVCPNDILAEEYDTATQIMGDGWRMPTEAEFQELLEDTTQEWVDDFNGTGVNGRKFTSKTDTSKYIFIPAAGWCIDGSMLDVGRYGNVWSSSLDINTSPDTASYVLFYHNYSGMYNIQKRYNGRSVRGVRK